MSLPTFEVTESKIICRKSLGLRVGIGVLGLLIGAMCLSLFYFFWPAPGTFADRSPADILSPPLSFLLVPLAGFFGPTALFLYTAGPEDLVVDTVQRTYRFRRGFPLLASWQSGPLTDIADLRVKTVTNKSVTSYQMMLDWKNTNVAPWTLGDGRVSSRRPFQMLVSRDGNRVRNEVQRLAPRLGVSIAETAPAWEQKRRRDQMRLVMVPVILFLVLLNLPPLLVSHSLETDGRAATGTVTAVRHGKGYSVRYTYPAGKRRLFEGRASVPWSFAQSLAVGSSVPVRYLPAYPHTSTVVGAQSDAASSFPALLLAGFLVVIVLTRRVPRD